MNVQKIAQLAMKAMTKANALPKAAKIGIALGSAGLIFGAGMLVGKSSVGDNFEKKAVETAKTETVELPKCDGEEIVEVKEVKSPIMGTVSKKLYLNPDGEIVRIEQFDKDNKLEKLGLLENGRCNTYDSTGKLIESVYSNDGAKIYFREDFYHQWGGGNIIENRYGEKGLEYQFITGENWYENVKWNDSYDPRVKTYSDSINPNRIIKEKHMSLDGTLQYTVVPKYDKDGDLIKNDTIWNKK